MAYPTVETYSQANTNAGANHVITMPSGIQVGDLLLVFFATDGDNTITNWQTFTELDSESNNTANFGAVGYKIATGSDTLTITVSVTNEPGSHIVYRISGWHGTTPPELSTVAEDATANPNSTSVTASWGADDNLFICSLHMDRNRSVTLYPANYTDNQYYQSGGGSGSCGVAVCSYNYNTTDTQDPAQWTISASDQWIAWTIVVRPTPGAASYSIQQNIDARVKAEGIQITPDINLRVKATFPIALGIDAIVKAVIPIPLDIDAYIKATIPITEEIDLRVKQPDIQITQNIDLRAKAEGIQLTLDIDLIVSIPPPSIKLDIDARVKVTIPIAQNIVLRVKLEGIQLVFDIDAKVKASIPIPLDIDARVRGAIPIPLDIDLRALAVFQIPQNIVLRVKQEGIKITQDIDLMVKIPVANYSIQQDIDLWVKASIPIPLDIDLRVKDVGIQIAQNINARVKSEGITITQNIDLMVKYIGVITQDIDGRVKATFIVAKEIELRVKAEGIQLLYNIDIRIKETFQITQDIDLIVKIPTATKVKMLMTIDLIVKEQTIVGMETIETNLSRSEVQNVNLSKQETRDVYMK